MRKPEKMLPPIIGRAPCGVSSERERCTRDILGRSRGRTSGLADDARRFARVPGSRRRAAQGEDIAMSPSAAREPNDSARSDGRTTLRKRKALFLDRDGVINVDLGYVHSPLDFCFLPGIFDVCRTAQALSYLVIVVTNQAGIARGYYSESEFLELTEWMTARFGQEGIHISRVYYCPYHPVHGVGRYKADSPDRKPHPGMLFRAKADFDLDLASSVLIGDKLSDIRAAEAAGIGTRILLQSETNHGKARDGEYWAASSLDEVTRRFFCAKR